jgi:hypothetical protein
MAVKHVVLSAALFSMGSLSLASFAHCDEPAVDAARAESLNRKIDEINAQLGKLDQIVEQLRRLRTEELPKLQNEVHERAEASVLVKNGEQTVHKPATDTPPLLPGDEEKGAADGASLEEQLTAVQKKLQQLDDVAAQISALRDQDLPRLKAEIGRIAGTGTAGDKRHEALRPVPPLQGRLVINNLTNLTRDVTVNGTTYRFEPGSWQVPVPYKEVTTQMSAWDIPNVWGTTLWKQTDSGPEMRLELK